MSETILAYPLEWPTTFPRTAPRDRQPGRFSASFSASRDGIVRELRLMGVRREDMVISSDVPLRRDGLPMATVRRMEDPGVAVWFFRGGRQVVVPCDKWTLVEDNLRAIHLTLAAIRGLERWGARELVDAAFAGFEALPAGVSGPGWWDVLGVARDATPDEIRTTFRALAKIHHPDVGGDPERFHAIQIAYEQATNESVHWEKRTA